MRSWRVITSTHPCLGCLLNKECITRTLQVNFKNMLLTKIKKYAVVFFALVLMSGMSAPQTYAQSAASSQQIAQLLAQIQLLQAQLAALTNGGVGTCSAVFSRDLGTGSTGADVLALQKFLNRSADTRVAISGAGSLGSETQFYGPATAAAVSKFQVKYRSEVLSPSGLVNPTGYFGSASRAKANALCSVTTPTPTNPTTPTDTSKLKGGEARLLSFQTNEGDDTSVSEGQDNAPVMDVEFEVEDGDIQVNRIDVAFDHITGGDSDPWDVFEDISIWVDGKKVASMDVDKKSAWSKDQPNSGDYSVRLSSIKDFIVREGKTAEFTVAITAAGHVDDAGSVEWEMFIPDNGIRAVDSEKIQHFIGETDETVSFDIVEAGAEADLVVRTSSDDPDAQVLQLDRSKVSNWLPVFAFELDADDSADDITINSLPVTVDVSDSETYNALVRSARLMIDGKKYDKVTITDGNTDTAVLVFDLGRNGHTIDAGDSATAKLELEFRALSEADEGTRLQAMITSSQADEIDAEGTDDLTASQISGSAQGEIHTLRTGGSTFAGVETSASLQTNSSATIDDDEGLFRISFNVTAFEQDLYVNKSALRGTNQDTAGVNYILEDSVGAEVAAGDVSAVLTSNADSVGNQFRVREGQTKRFTVIVEYDPATTGFYQLQLYSFNHNDIAGDPDTYQRMQPESVYETDPLSI